jgi:hypothetical protein
MGSAAAAAAPNAGVKKKLTIIPCEMNKAGNISTLGPGFEVMINPAGYTHERKINYSRLEHFGAIATRNKFSRVEPEEINFEEIVIDGTGVVAPSTAGGTTPDVKTQIKTLSDIVYKYNGSYHEPTLVKLVWSSLIFVGRLKSMSVNYTLFKPGGDPLRAKIKLSFTGAMSAQEEAARANMSSPDLTHEVVVVEGDTLPLLCDRIYRDSSYYPEIARHNRLSNFRRLVPGTRLSFPPLN